MSDATRPRSYVIEVPSGQVQRNGKHLSVIPQDSSELDTGETLYEFCTVELLPRYLQNTTVISLGHTFPLTSIS